MEHPRLLPRDRSVTGKGGPTRESASFMTQERPMLPRDGRMADAPHVSAGLIKLPSVSLPTEKGTVPATTLATGP